MSRILAPPSVLKGERDQRKPWTSQVPDHRESSENPARQNAGIDQAGGVIASRQVLILGRSETSRNL